MGRKTCIVVKGLRANSPKINVKPWTGECASHSGMRAKREIFDEEYRVLSVESHTLIVQGVRSGEVLKIVNQNPEAPLTPADYPPGKLIALSDPWRRPAN